MALDDADLVRVGLDQFVTAEEGCHLLTGWVAVPRGARLGLTVLADGTQCEALHFTTHPRPDVSFDDPTVEVRGFVQVIGPPPPAFEWALAVSADNLAVEILLPPPIEGRLGELVLNWSWIAVYSLLRSCLAEERLGGVMESGESGLGPFAEWLERVPLLPATTGAFGPVQQGQALASPAGEVTLHLGFAGGQAHAPEVHAVALVPGGDGRPRALPFGEIILDHAEQHVSFYGRLAEARLPCTIPAVLVEIAAGGTRHWLRWQPERLSVPAFLSGQEKARIAAGCNDPAASLAWLRGLLLSREEGFRPVLAGLGLTQLAPAGNEPRVLLLLGLNNPLCARLVEAAAPEIEAYCTEAVLVGRHAAEAGQSLMRRGRVPVQIGPSLGAVLRRGSLAGSTVVMSDATHFAEALIEGRVAALCASGFPGTHLADLRAFSAIAGSGEAEEVMQRLVHARGERRGAAAPRFPAIGGIGGAAAGQHLEALWRVAAAPLAEAAEVAEVA